MKPLYIDESSLEKKAIHIKTVSAPFLDRPFHFHSNCELVLILESFGKRIVGDNIGNFREGDLVLIGPGLPHIWHNDNVFYKQNEKSKARAIVVYFSPQLLERLLDNESLSTINNLVSRSKRGLWIPGKTREAVSEQLQSLPEKEGIEQLIRFLSVLNILCRSKECRYLSSPQFNNTYNEKDTGRIDKVFHFLIQNFTRPLTLKETASVAHMAPNAFCRYFRQRTGKTLTRFLNELRIDHARDLLRTTTQSISEICYASGFNNLTNFNKFFKSITGITPTACRHRTGG